MSSDLEVRATNVADLDRLEPAQREVAVTGMLDQCRHWLATAVEATEPRRISEFKAFVATIAETTKQLNLSKEIQLDASEMVRRAERGVGLAIRKGQVDGNVIAPGRNPYSGNQHDRGGGHVSNNSSTCARPVTDYATRDELSANGTGIYNLTDNVSDEQFDTAVAEAKEEGNLSRANVVRKIKGESRPAGKRHELLRKTHHIKPERVIFETVNALEGLCMGLGLIESKDFAGLDPDKRVAWSSSLAKSIQSLNRLRKELNRVPE